MCTFSNFLGRSRLILVEIGYFAQKDGSESSTFLFTPTQIYSKYSNNRFWIFNICYQMHHMQQYISIYMQQYVSTIWDRMQVYASKWSNIQLYQTQSTMGGLLNQMQQWKHYENTLFCIKWYEKPGIYTLRHWSQC